MNEMQHNNSEIQPRNESHPSSETSKVSENLKQNPKQKPKEKKLIDFQKPHLDFIADNYSIVKSRDHIDRARLNWIVVGICCAILLGTSAFIYYQAPMDLPPMFKLLGTVLFTFLLGSALGIGAGMLLQNTKRA